MLVSNHDIYYWLLESKRQYKLEINLVWKKCLKRWKINRPPRSDDILNFVVSKKTVDIGHLYLGCVLIYNISNTPVCSYDMIIEIVEVKYQLGIILPWTHLNSAKKEGNFTLLAKKDNLFHCNLTSSVVLHWTSILQDCAHIKT